MADQCPYVGPRPFKEDEERFFFGRTEEIEILTSLVVARRASLLFAQSGAGKSSLLTAGLTPRLLRHERLVRERRTVQALVSGIKIARVGRGMPAANPANIFVQSALLSLQSDASTAVPPDATISDLVSAWLPVAPASEPDASAGDDAADETRLPFLLVFDQFEEIFTKHLDLRRQREDFFTQVVHALEQHAGLRVLFSMREDYIAELTPYAHLLPDQLRPRFRLERLKGDAALEAITGPAETAEVPHPFAAGVAERLCVNLKADGSDDIEPILLQVVCKRLWQNLPNDHPEILEEDAKQFGDVDKALVGYYCDAVDAVVDEVKNASGQPLSERRVRRFFSEAILTPSRTRALVYRDEESGFTAGLVNPAIDVLSRSDVNIIRGEARGGGHWYELSHDRLIRPVLASNEEWERSNTTILYTQAAEWNSRGRRDEGLLTRIKLREAEDRIRKNPDDPLTPLEEEFLLKSRQGLASASALLRVNIEELGWGVVFAEDDPRRAELRLALKPLLEHRRRQTESRFPDSEFVVKAGESASQFLARHGALARAGVGIDRMPYYLLLVGDPDRIPFEFQYALDARYAVGRLDLEGTTREETLLMHARYAESVVAAESGQWGLPRRAVIFSPVHVGDTATAMVASELVRPMVEELQRADLTLDEWQVAPVLEDLATRESLLRLLGGDRMPALLFVVAHGVARPSGDDRQLDEQGAIVCADWTYGSKLEPEMYVAGRDVGAGANPLGMIMFMVGEYGAGTPELENRPTEKEPRRLAERAFVARLSQRLLGHPNGGALAVIGHVDTSWIHTFQEYFDSSKPDQKRWKSEGNKTFVNTVSRLVRGHTVGSAMEFLNLRYTQAAADLVDALLNRAGRSDAQVERMMLEAVDVRNYIVLGDPAVRLPVDGPVSEQRPVVQVDAGLVAAIDAALSTEKAEPATAAVPAAAVGGAPPMPAPAAAPQAAEPDVAAPAAALGAPDPPRLDAFFNGIDIETGEYFYRPLSLEELAKLATGGESSADPESAALVDEAYRAAGSSYFSEKA
ncbi:MAG: hypothetical protein ABI647_19805 [Gemmatimonadota bacterium]